MPKLLTLFELKKEKLWFYTIGNILRVPGILLQGKWAWLMTKSVEVLSTSTNGRWGLENPREFPGCLAPAPTQLYSIYLARNERETPVRIIKAPSSITEGYIY